MNKDSLLLIKQLVEGLLLQNDTTPEAWVTYCKTKAEGNKLCAEGDKLYAEGRKLCAEGYKRYAECFKRYAEGDELYAEGNKLRAEGVIQLMDYIIKTYGPKTKIEWSDKGLKVGDETWLY